LVACAGPTLRFTGWRGGQWVQYVTPTSVDDFIIEISNGAEVAGFLIFGSENYQIPSGAPENYVGHQMRLDQDTAAGASTVTIVAGGGRFLFSLFETTALAGDGSRTGGVITYALNENLKVSENGLLCNDSDANLIAAGIPVPVLTGTCCAIPSARTGQRLGLDLKY